jgi:hypothetical protein
MLIHAGNTKTNCQVKRKRLGSIYSKKMKALSDKYQQQAKDISDDTPDPGPVGGALDLDFDVGWKNESIKFDLPEFKMVTQQWIFDVPQVTMKNQEMIFHTPSSRLVNRKIGQYPEFHGLSVVWKDIIVGITVTGPSLPFRFDWLHLRPEVYQGLH